MIYLRAREFYFEDIDSGLWNYPLAKETWLEARGYWLRSHIDRVDSQDVHLKSTTTIFQEEYDLLGDTLIENTKRR